MSTNVATSPASSKAESQDYHQVSTEELETRGLTSVYIGKPFDCDNGPTIYIQKPFDCYNAPTYCRNNYPFVIDCSDLLNVLSSDDATDFIITLKNSISGYDDVLAYAMPDHRIVVLTGLLLHEQRSDEIIQLAIGCTERMLSLSKIDGRVEIGTRPAISSAG